MTEQQIEAKIKKRLESEGWLVIKLMKTSWNGIPDRICLRRGTIMFIEVKRPEGVLSALQKERIRDLRSRGFEVKIWEDYGKDFKSGM